MFGNPSSSVFNEFLVSVTSLSVDVRVPRSDEINLLLALAQLDNIPGVAPAIPAGSL
jgi:hypothetical protein